MRVHPAKVMLVEILTRALTVPAVVAVKAPLAVMVFMYLPALPISGITAARGEQEVNLLTFCRTQLLPLAVAVVGCTIQVLVVTLAPQALVALVLAVPGVIIAVQATQQQIAVAVAVAAQELRRVTPL